MNSTREHSFLSRLVACVSLALLLLVPSLAKAWNNDVTVNTAYGAVEGSLSNDGTTMIWQGVPYAKPPVDDFVNQIYLRWKAPQDQAPWRPHITVQNKVAPKAAKALLTELDAAFVPRPLKIAGLASWHYRGGPWEPLSEHRFRT